MAINGATIRADTWNTIRTAIIGLYPGKTIQAKFPEDPTKITKADYPLIVVKNPEVDQDGGFFGRTRSSKVCDTMVEVYSNNPADIDSIPDTIINHFETVKLADLHVVNVADSTTGNLEINKQNVLFKVMSVSTKHNG